MASSVPKAKMAVSSSSNRKLSKNLNRHFLGLCRVAWLQEAQTGRTKPAVRAVGSGRTGVEP
jgi:hypothetical protein